MFFKFQQLGSFQKYHYLKIKHKNDKKNGSHYKILAAIHELLVVSNSFMTFATLGFTGKLNEAPKAGGPLIVPGDHKAFGCPFFIYYIVL